MESEEASSSVLGVKEEDKASSYVLAGEEALHCSTLGSEEVGTSALTSKTSNRLCEIEHQENSDDDFIDVHPRDSTGPMAKQQSSETTLNEYLCFIKEMVKDYGDGETDVALKRVMKLGRKYCKSSNYLNM